MSLRIMRLEERIVLEGTGLVDDDNTTPDSPSFDSTQVAVADDDQSDTHDTADTHDPVYDGAADDSGATADDGTDAVRLLVVSESISGSEVLADAAADNVVTVEYNPNETTLAELLAKMTDALDGREAESIGFAVHGVSDGRIALAEDGNVGITSLLTSEDQQDFWRETGELLSDNGRIDILSCDLTSTESGQLLVGEIENLSGADVTASDDTTGGDDVGGDWIMETGNVDVSSVYFDQDQLGSFSGRMAAPAFSGLDSTPTYNEDQAAADPTTIIDSDATITDSDGDGDVDGAVLTVSYDGASGTATDQLTILETGSGANAITLGTGTISYGGTQVATFTGGDNGNQLAITFDSDANLSIASRVLQSVSYHNTGDDPGTSRVIQFDYSDGTVFDATADAAPSVDISLTIVPSNDAPTNVALSASSVNENQAVGTVVATLSATDPDSADSHTYSLVAGTGDTNNGDFTIVGNELRTAAGFDYESATSKAIRIQVSDGNGGTFAKEFTININNINDAPTDIALDSSSVAENSAASTVVGNLSTVDQDSADTHTYSLVAGTGDTDNASFTISGGQLLTAASFDYESATTKSVRVQVSDGNGGVYEKALTINITPVNETPTNI
ncbi:MAG: DUF4347 domain-containing protein, partial [Planctomycetes bacterium]|nr:DUF4347 domain-containing protein [Planctomycetota bacterium]